jgi:hypothetical protein
LFALKKDKIASRIKCIGKCKVRDVPPVWYGMVRTTPLLENFQFFPAKIVDFISKKITKLKKYVLHHPTFEKSYLDFENSEKISLHHPTFFFAAHPCAKFSIFYVNLEFVLFRVIFKIQRTNFNDSFPGFMNNYYRLSKKLIIFPRNTLSFNDTN